MPDPGESEFLPSPRHPVVREESESWPDRVGTTTLGSGYEAVLVEDAYGIQAGLISVVYHIFCDTVTTR